MKNQITILILFIVLGFCSLQAQVTQEWVQIYNGPGNEQDIASSIAVDSSGNVYVTGRSGVYENYDYATIKYNSSGDSLWVARFNGPANGNDFATSLAVDGSGNVYVTGYSNHGGFNYDFVTIKYNSSGIQLWVKSYKVSTDLKIGPPLSLAVDSLGNVYVSGSSIRQLFDYVTIKYNSSGVLQWVQIYNGPGNNHDLAYSLAVDDSGNVYVTGASFGIGTGADYATIKYNSSGVQQWVQRYNGPENGYEGAFSLALDDFANVYVTGGIIWQGGTGSDYATIKYNSSGDSLWVQRYNGPGNHDDVANSISVDGSGNVYVTGWSVGTERDYATIKYNSSGMQQWVQRFNGAGNYSDYANSLSVDNSGNVYVTGNSTGIGTGYDYATIKYSQLTGISQTSNSIPEKFSLSQNYPNPFNPKTIINYQLSMFNFVSLKVFDVLGNEVATLVNEKQNAGSYEVDFNGSNFSSGVYFYKLQTDNFSETKKMTLLK